MNTLKAIEYIIRTNRFDLKNIYQSRNRANNMGENLEEYVKDIFAQSLFCESEQERLEKISNTFSYLGNSNNPPDSILRYGDAIEVKKVESYYSSLALNSSYPKDKLRITDPLISKSCRNCEPNWEQKDILYIVGVVDNSRLRKLFMVYGIDYAADYSVYERLKNTIKNGVESIPGIHFENSKELGHINRVDPLGITYFRVRGMWGIENPFKVFSYILQPMKNVNFELFAIINNDKFNSFPEEDRNRLINLTSISNNFNIINVKIKNPNNPALLKDAKLLHYIFN